jgi:hypothetical protein
MAPCALILILQSPAFCEEFARPPEFPPKVKDVFFDDARKALSGSPPTDDIATQSAAQEKSRDDQSSATWKELIDADALTTEVKQITNRVAALAGKPGQFKAAGHEDCRRELSLLAALFSVIREYPEEIRWQKSARSLENSCLRAAASCAEGSVESLATVRETLLQLENLLRGQPVTGDTATDEASVPELPPLMQHMEYMLQEELPPLLGKQVEFRKQTAAVAQQAQLLAMLSQVIRRQEYGYADDEAYQSHADKLRDEAKQLRAAAGSEDFAKAVEAAASVSRACADCHGDYRG